MPRSWTLAGLVLLGLALRLPGISHDVDGIHIFRQVHVAANIHFLVEGGPSLLTRRFTENALMPAVMGADAADYRIYDGPLYQNLVALLVRATGWPLALTARVLNLCAFVVGALALVALLRATRVAEPVVPWAVFFYVTSPLLMFYERAVIPDPLAATLALLALVAYFRWNRPMGSRGWYVVLLLAVNVAAYIKSPVALPVVLVMIGHALWTGSWRRRPFIAVIGLTGASVIACKLFANWVNVGRFDTPAWESAWYFGALADRFDPGQLGALFGRLGKELVTVVGVVMAGIALVRSRRMPGVYLVWLGAAIVTILLFFPLHAFHNYYQIPFVALASVFAGYGAERLGGVSLLLRLSIVAGTLFASYAGRLPHGEPTQLLAAGRLLQANVPADGYIIYVVGDLGNSAYMPYFARRQGLPVRRTELTLDKVCGNGRGVYVDVPSQLDEGIAEFMVPLQATVLAHGSGRTVLAGSTGESCVRPCGWSRPWYPVIS